MPRKHVQPTKTDRELALTALTWLLIATPVASLWARPALGWLAPYALWSALILCALGLSMLRHKRKN